MMMTTDVSFHCHRVRGRPCLRSHSTRTQLSTEHNSRHSPCRKLCYAESWSPNFDFLGCAGKRGGEARQ